MFHSGNLRVYFVMIFGITDIVW